MLEMKIARAAVAAAAGEVVASGASGESKGLLRPRGNPVPGLSGRGNPIRVTRVRLALAPRAPRVAWRTTTS